MTRGTCLCNCGLTPAFAAPSQRLHPNGNTGAEPRLAYITQTPEEPLSQRRATDPDAARS